jgi:hypothetical protein
MEAPERLIVDDLIERSLRPSAATWLKHIGILLVTLITTTVAGVLFPFGIIPTLPDTDPQSFSEIVDFVGSLPARYIALVGTAVISLATDLTYLAYGITSPAVFTR